MTTHFECMNSSRLENHVRFYDSNLPIPKEGRKRKPTYRQTGCDAISEPTNPVVDRHVRAAHDASASPR